MSAEAFFDSAREYKRELTGEGLTEADVAALNAIIAGWHHPANPTALTDAAAFFASLHPSFGPLSETQVQGFQTLLQAFGVAQWPIAWAAYGLATAYHETAYRMQPVAEAFFLGDKAAQKYRASLEYSPWYGRGYPQLTWQKNYAWADRTLGLNGALLADPDMALQPDIAAKIMVKGMETGAFTGRSLADCLPAAGEADVHQFANARRIINGLDKAVEIAGHALKFQDALQAGGWR